MISATQILGGGNLDEVYAQISASGTTSVLRDAANSTLLLTNNAAAIAGSYSYSPYGAATSSGTSATPLQFTGRDDDGASGLYYYRTRYYSPQLSRFISQDPAGLAGGINTYAYAGGNPVSNSDPSGQFYITFTNIWIPAGEQYGAAAAQYWADRQTQTGNPLYAIPGLLASLWTPCTSGRTGLALASGGALGSLTEGASLSNFFWNSNSFRSISSAYWGAEGAGGMSLDHWLFSQAAARAGTIPSGIANAGFNLLEMPGSWNTWLGFAPNWGGTQALLANLARLGIQAGVPAAAATAGAAGYAVGSDANRCGCQ
jgi:RHS repeat-associated protein